MLGVVGSNLKMIKVFMQHLWMLVGGAVALYTQVYKWVLASCWGNLTNCGEATCDGLASRQGEVEILLAASYFRNQDKPWQL